MAKHLFHIFNVHCHCGACSGDNLTCVCANFSSPCNGAHFGIACNPLVTLLPVGSLWLWRGAHFDISRASFSSLCACQIAFVVAPCWFCQYLLYRPCTVQRSCIEACYCRALDKICFVDSLYRDLVQRSATETCYKDLDERNLSPCSLHKVNLQNLSPCSLHTVWGLLLPGQEFYLRGR